MSYKSYENAKDIYLSSTITHQTMVDENIFEGPKEKRTSDYVIKKQISTIEHSKN